MMITNKGRRWKMEKVVEGGVCMKQFIARRRLLLLFRGRAHAMPGRCTLGFRAPVVAGCLPAGSVLYTFS